MYYTDETKPGKTVVLKVLNLRTLISDHLTGGGDVVVTAWYWHQHHILALKKEKEEEKNWHWHQHHILALMKLMVMACDVSPVAMFEQIKQPFNLHFTLV